MLLLPSFHSPYQLDIEHHDMHAGCNIALYYNTGFCYLMQRRYLDAARAFNTGLAYINRCSPLSTGRQLAVSRGASAKHTTLARQHSAGRGTSSQGLRYLMCHPCGEQRVLKGAPVSAWPAGSCSTQLLHTGTGGMRSAALGHRSCTACH